MLGIWISCTSLLPFSSAALAPDSRSRKNRRGPANTTVGRRNIATIGRTLLETVPPPPPNFNVDENGFRRYRVLFFDSLAHGPTLVPTLKLGGEGARTVKADY